MSNAKSVRQVLVDARELLVDHWDSGELYSSYTGCYCALGAIGKASGIDNAVLERQVEYRSIHPDAVKALADAIIERDSDYLYEEVTDTVWNYNDDEGRDATLEAFDAAIAKLPE